MYQYNNTIFNQLLNFLPKYKFEQFVGQHNGNKATKRMSAWNQFVVLMYAQITGKKSLRDIETGFNMHNGVWYHLGVKSVARSTLSDANKNRDCRIYEKLFYALLEQCKEVTFGERKFKFKNKLYSFDSTTIQLCLSVFDWAKYRTTKGALKMHLLLDNRTAIPEFINITEGKVGDITVFKKLDLKHLEKGSILTFDRAYIAYEWWKKIDENELFFVSRTKSTQNIFVTGQHENKIMESGVIADEIVILADYNTMEKKKYPKKLRKIKYYDKENKKEYEYLTNNFELTAKQIADIYKDRWQIELFFKWIKQNLKIKTFLGTSKNAVMTQIWIAMIYYLLLAYIKFQTKFGKSLLELTRMIKETLMFRRHLIDLLSFNSNTVHKLNITEIYQMSFF